MLPPDGPSPFWANRSSASMWSLIIQEVAARPSPFARSNQSVETRRIDDGQPPRVKQDRGNSVVPERLEVMFQGRDRRHVQLAPEGDPRDPGSRIDDGLEVLAGPHVPFLSRGIGAESRSTRRPWVGVRIRTRDWGPSLKSTRSRPAAYRRPACRVRCRAGGTSRPALDFASWSPMDRADVRTRSGRLDRVFPRRLVVLRRMQPAKARSVVGGEGRSRIRPGCTPVRWVAL